MAAVVLAIGVTQEVQLSATPNTMQEVTFPLNGRKILVLFRDDDGKLLLSGGTDATLITTEASHRVVADALAEFDAPGTNGRAVNLDAATRKVWIASATASAVVEITAL